MITLQSLGTSLPAGTRSRLMAWNVKNRQRPSITVLPAPQNGPRGGMLPPHAPRNSTLHRCRRAAVPGPGTGPGTEATGRAVLLAPPGAALPSGWQALKLSSLKRLTHRAGRRPGCRRAERTGRRRGERSPRCRQLRHHDRPGHALALEDQQPDRRRGQRNAPRKTRRCASCSASRVTSRSSRFASELRRRLPRRGRDVAAVCAARLHLVQHQARGDRDQNPHPAASRWSSPCRDRRVSATDGPPAQCLRGLQARVRRGARPHDGSRRAHGHRHTARPSKPGTATSSSGRRRN